MTEGLPPPPDVRALLAAAGLHAKKSWGQNFLLDASALADIARASGAGPEQPVVELGAGLGALTYHLVARGGRVLAVERDRELAPILRAALAWATRLEVREADAARLDYAALAQELGGPLAVTGNLPYQLSGRILVALAGARPVVRQAAFLVQREVAERLASPPGCRAYGLLTVLVQRSFEVRIVRQVPPGAFLPPPKVHSAVVRLEARAAVGASDAALVAAARAAFHARRKTLKNAVAGALAASPAAVEAAVLAAGLDPVARAETLAVADFGRLGDALVRAGLVHVS